MVWRVRDYVANGALRQTKRGRGRNYLVRPSTRGHKEEELMVWLSELQKYGVGFTAGGVIFFLLGIVTFFDSALLALGNLLFIIGVILIIGPQKTVVFFTRPQKIRGSICFVVGILLILFKWSFFGFIVEAVGILQLFGDFFGVIISFMRQLPVIGPILSHPYVAPTIDRLSGTRILPV